MSDNIAETLRRAAALMRDRAEAATPDEWEHMCLGSEGCFVGRKHATIRDRGRGRVARFGSKDWQADHADAQYVASMAPPVAFAMADWLAAEAVNAPGEGEVYFRGGRTGHALNVARAYLGEVES